MAQSAYDMLDGLPAVSDIVIEGQFSEAARANMDSWSACVSGALPVDDDQRDCQLAESPKSWP